MSQGELAAWLGPGGRYDGDVQLSGRVRIDGTWHGKLRVEDVVEVGPTGVVVGEIDALQVLIAGRVEGVIHARERATLLETAIIEGQLVSPWVDVRIGARLRAEVITDGERSASGARP